MRPLSVNTWIVIINVAVFLVANVLLGAPNYKTMTGRFTVEGVSTAELEKGTLRVDTPLYFTSIITLAEWLLNSGAYRHWMLASPVGYWPRCCTRIPRRSPSACLRKARHACGTSTCEAQCVDATMAIMGLP